ncbi:MAG: glycosyltransferase [Lachnospiraceae bacterium]|nr:glycosyltransferase [Lachnospiraceae bacterium]
MSGKRKLMLVSPMLHQGGFERICVTTARLMAAYFDITVVIFDSSDIAYDVDGLHIIDLKLGVKRGKLRKIWNIVRRSRRLYQLKKQLKPDICYSFGTTANIVNALSKTKKTKVWLGLRSYMDMEEQIKIKLFVKLADLIICCSKVIEQELKSKFHCDKTTTLYNLYDVEDIQKQAEEKEPDLPWSDVDNQGRELKYMISMGREDAVKGFWHMLKAFSLIHAKIPEARLVILGDGSFAPYKKLAEDLKIQDAVHFAGMQKEPYKYLKKGSIYLLTSLREGFPNALVEGMALGLAPISTDCMTGPAEILLDEINGERFKLNNVAVYGKYGILIPVMNEEPDFDAEQILQEERNLADIVVDLLVDDRKLQNYQSAAKERAQFFTYESYIRQFLQLACEKNTNMVE